MRKLVLVFAMSVSMTLASCGNSTNSSEAQNDSVNVDSTTVVDSVAADSAAVDSTNISLN